MMHTILSSSRDRSHGLALAIVIFFHLSSALAQPSEPAPAPSAAPLLPPDNPPAPSADDEAARAEAKQRASEIFKEAKKLYDKGEFAEALSRYQATFRLYPSWRGLTGVGTCLVKLQRYDEALEVFEAALRDFGADLPPAAKTSALEQVDLMRTVTGGVAVTGAEVGAIIVVDGRVRGEHPTPGALNVLAGPHLVRVYKEGFALFEQSIEVEKGQTESLTMKLERLPATSGRLKVEETSGIRMEVVVDGVPVGQTPWLGPISAGEHAVVLRAPPEPKPPPVCGAAPPVMTQAVAEGQQSLATAPKRVVVKPNQTVGVRLKAERLDAAIRVLPAPAAASVVIDGDLVSRGGFEGRLKPGEHVIKVEADGFFTETQKINVPAGEVKEIQVSLRRDYNSPAWAEGPRILLELSGGAALAPSFGGDIAAGCAGNCKRGMAAGGRVALRGGYELSNGFSLGATAGYLGMHQSTTGRASTLLPLVPADKEARSDGSANDDVSLHALLVGPYAAYRVGKQVPLHLGLAAGVGLGSVSDRRTGLFGASAVGPVVQSGFYTWAFVEPEVRVGVRVLDRLTLGITISGLLLFAPRAPQWNESMRISPHGSTLGLTEERAQVAGTFGAETVMGSTMAAITEGVSVRYEF
ncbi:MAG TPA: PEGA domain-containing protein [Polyangiaceae bacterium]|nr:PEGA domain-containing protein [Polyangiaceae bacterium]